RHHPHLHSFPTRRSSDLGSHCTYDAVYPQIQKLMDENAEVIPIVSYTVRNIDTKFGKAEEHIEKIESITKRRVISTMPEAEPLGPKEPLDIMVIAPLTGNSLSKLANRSEEHT